MKNSTNFDALRISLASPEEIKSWSYGEVTKAETINYRTLKPEKDGLFDERIFGPTKDLECYCGKYKRQRYKGVVCDKCGVEVTYSRVRRERMGHIELAAPVIHTWYFKRTPNKLPAVLDIGLRDLESVIYFAQYLVVEVDDEKRNEILTKLNEDLEARKKQFEAETNEQIELLKQEMDENIAKIEAKESLTDADELKIEDYKQQNRREILYLREELIQTQTQLEDSFKEVTDLISSIEVNAVISEGDMSQLMFWDADLFFRAGMGAEAITEALQNLDLEEAIVQLNKEIRGKSQARRKKAIKRLKIIQGMKDANIEPIWMVMTVLPVIPPELRPMVQLPGGRFATSDLNDLYRRVINRNNRLGDLIELGAPEIILKNEKRMLQESVDSLIEGTRKLTRGRKELQSLSDMLKGKQGRFRQNLLGKRVDYSGRSVIVVGPNLNIDQVGIPKEMALELFKPFVLRDLIREGYAPNLKSAKNVLEARGDEVWDILERVTKDHPVLLNRAPTLHRQNIQSFFPVLIEGKAIQFHPAVVGAFAGDFDGDQMAIHVPLSVASIEEARTKLLTPNNLLKLSHGNPIIDLKNEITFGLYYLTLIDQDDEQKGIEFYTPQQVTSAYHNEKIHIHCPIKLMVDGEMIETTPGRVIFNELLPEKLKFVNEPVNRDKMHELIAMCFDNYGQDETARLVDVFKNLGQRYATVSGLSWSIADFKIPESREQIIADAHKKIDEIEDSFNLGLLTQRERHNQIITIWEEVSNKVSDTVADMIQEDDVIGMMVHSDAFKVNQETLRQVQGIRGLMVDSQGMIKETPILTSFLEGQTGFEGFLNQIGGRKSLIDVALMTADAGYLSRRLVDATHDVIVREIDCEPQHGITVYEDNGVEDWSLYERLEGRTALHDIKDSKGNVLVEAGELITPEQAQAVVDAKITEATIRSPLTCETRYGVCAKCYGKDLATRQLVEVGEAVGIIAAQSIGEPGTQLTLHSKHRAGAAMKEITQGLPRVEQLFEARTPKGSAVLSEITGTVTDIKETDDEMIIEVTPEKSSEDSEPLHYSIPPAADIAVKKGEKVLAGDSLTEGYVELDDILNIKGILAVQKYLLREIQSVYKSQGVTIKDKHVETVISKMCEKVRIKDAGDTGFLPGEFVNIYDFTLLNETMENEGKEPATGSRAILGISRTALLTDSWLSASSFEETANVLASASINERPNMDYLLGLKENVIIGKLIPTGKRSKVKSNIIEQKVTKKR